MLIPRLTMQYILSELQKARNPYNKAYNLNGTNRLELQMDH